MVNGRSNTLVKDVRLIVIGGFAGAGKSTLARRLGDVLCVPVFEIDQIARNIHDSKDFHGTRKEALGVAFDFFYPFAKQCLQNRASLILDQNMGHPITWQNVAELSEQVENAEMKIIILDCPYEVCVQRFYNREKYPHKNEVNIHEHKYKWDYLNENDFAGVHRIDATQPSEAVFRETLLLLSRPC